MADYKSENVEIGWYSFLKPEDAEKLVGKTIVKIVGNEFSLMLTFTDGSTLETAGAGRDGLPLHVEADFNEGEPAF